MKTIKYLENKTKLSITKLDQTFSNSIYIGHSNRRNKLFIKVYEDSSNFTRETEVLKLIERDIVFEDKFEGKYILAIPFKDIGKIHNIDLNFIRNAARTVAELHLTNISNVNHSLPTPSLLQVSEYMYNSLEDNYKELYSEYYSFFNSKKELLMREEDSLDKVLLHGDFSVKNIGYSHSQVYLFDFEHSIIQTPWYDFMLIFNSKLGLGLEIVTFLSEYKKYIDLQPISEDMMALLQFIQLLKIHLYYLAINEDKVLLTTLDVAKINLRNKLNKYMNSRLNI